MYDNRIYLIIHRDQVWHFRNPKNLKSNNYTLISRALLIPDAKNPPNGAIREA